MVVCNARYIVEGPERALFGLRVGPDGVAVEIIGHDLVDFFPPEAEAFGDFEIEALARAARGDAQPDNAKGVAVTHGDAIDLQGGGVPKGHDVREHLGKTVLAIVNAAIGQAGGALELEVIGQQAPHLIAVADRGGVIQRLHDLPQPGV